MTSLEENLRGMQEGAEPPIRNLRDERFTADKRASIQQLKMKIERLHAQILILESSLTDGSTS